MMKRIYWICMVLTILLLTTSCSQQQPRYVIGVSQCSEDIWREKQNAELRMGAYIHGNVEVRFASAYDSDQRQIQQIDSLVGTGIDLLIVAPNQVATISPAIDRAYDKGIPVIVFERKTNSKKYTAFIGADNYEMGRLMGEYIAQQLNGQGRILEIKGLKDSSPAIERHNGFAKALSRYPQLQLIDTLQGDWTEQSAYDAVRKWASSATPIDFVFGQNDRMAVGARKALSSLNPNLSTKYCGIDGLPGDEGGIQLVRDSVLEASYIYPTHGDQLIQLAVNILDGKPYEKENLLKSALVTRANANIVQMETEETMRQTAYLDQLHEKADSYLQELATQRTMTWMLVAIIFIITVSAILVVTNMQRRHRLERQAFSMVVNVPQSETAPATLNPSPSPQQPTTITDVTPEEQAMMEADSDARFLERLRQYVQEQMSNSDFSVEDLATQMGVSRVQLYRKVKAQTGRTPVDIIRLSRLNRSKVLLQTTDFSVSEIAYQVGFTAPSYFTKCFKEEFGMLPGDTRKS
ncbi:MAG: substrate-binding domain-containing protein [Prevotella sp.]|nr:substrate-binding domain-containing protein [Prevotella sp.]